MRAQPTLETLLEANAQFYRAFEALDARELIAMWESSDRVYCVHPGWNPLVGYEPVVKSFRRILDSTSRIQFSLSQVQGHVMDNIGVVTLIETVSSRVGDASQAASTAVTNLFAFDATSGAWKIFHHHASNAVPADIPPLDVLN